MEYGGVQRKSDQWLQPTPSEGFEKINLELFKTLSPTNNLEFKKNLGDVADLEQNVILNKTTDTHQHWIKSVGKAPAFLLGSMMMLVGGTLSATMAAITLLMKGATIAIGSVAGGVVGVFVGLCAGKPIQGLLTGAAVGTFLMSQLAKAATFIPTILSGMIGVVGAALFNVCSEKKAGDNFMLRMNDLYHESREVGDAVPSSLVKTRNALSEKTTKDDNMSEATTQSTSKGKFTEEEKKIYFGEPPVDVL